MKLSTKEKELLKLLIQGKGQFKTPTIPKDSYEKDLDSIVIIQLLKTADNYTKASIHCPFLATT